MSRQFAQSKQDMAICSACGHDLYCYPKRIGKKGGAFIYCTNNKCKFHKKPHKTGKQLNTGAKSAS